MSIYHYSAQIIKRSEGRSSVASSAYRAAEKYTDSRIGKTFDFSRKEAVDHTMILAPADAPSFVKDRSQLWNAVEHFEVRKDAQLAREINIAIPVELPRSEMIELVKMHAQRFVDMGMVADICFHQLDSHNPHAHVMLTMRELEGDMFAKKKNREWNAKDLMKYFRESWANDANLYLAKNSIDERIDHRSLAEQAIDREPQKHLGPNVVAMQRRGAKSHVVESIKEERQEHESVVIELAETQAQIRGLKAQLAERKEASKAVPGIANKISKIDSVIAELKAEAKPKKQRLKAAKEELLEAGGIAAEYAGQLPFDIAYKRVIPAGMKRWITRKKEDYKTARQEWGDAGILRRTVDFWTPLKLHKLKQEAENYKASVLEKYSTELDIERKNILELKNKAPKLEIEIQRLNNDLSELRIRIHGLKNKRSKLEIGEDLDRDYNHAFER